ncbi:hypothetical protein ACRB68_25860 [Actinomadura sp. RB68]|uniref:Golvesin/Xly CBD-like domain-containing protein n=2 Tax=Actinomadura macrotermitis TaxID=2585200 RepID=A0A7K0BTQ5_9ACTN|nr:hypothetical protein [Actinomadura macrotermitis]
MAAPPPPKPSTPAGNNPQPQALPVGPATVNLDQRTATLGKSWNNSSDRAWTTSSDAEGFHLLVADKKSGYTWRTAASLSEPGFDADMWIGNACVTGSGKRAVVAYAPRTFTNKPELMARGAFAALVNLDTGKVTKLSRQVSLAYFSPGCGLGEEAVFTQLGGEKKNATRLIKVNAVTAHLGAPIALKGEVTSTIPVGDGFVAADGARLVKISKSGKRTALARTGRIPFLLKADAQGGVTYMDRPAPTARTATAPGAGSAGQGEVRRITSGQITHPNAKKTQAVLLASGPLGNLDLTSAADGKVFVTGQGKAAGKLPASVQVRPDVPRDATATTRGEGLVTRTAWADSKDPRGMARLSANQRTAKIGLRTLGTGKDFEFHVLPGQKGVARTIQGGRLSPALPAPAKPSGKKTQLRAGTVDDDRTCAVPRNDPAKQATQPKPRQVEWAVNMAVTGNLNSKIYREANWKNLGMPAYHPQDADMFPLKSLAGGGRVPMQVMLGITAQESNMWQASRVVVPGVTGNSLIGNYYGIKYAPDGQQGDPWAINWADADCGYGITQVTDGMRLPGKEKPGETAKSSKQQQAVALDYTANIAAGVNILIDKWNQTYNAGLKIDNADPQWMETWYFALWAYNSGFYPASDAPKNAGTWGLGFTNNPANPLWKANRPPFLSNADGSKDDYSHAAHPQDWPYQEKVLGWAGHPLQGLESPGTMVVGFRPAWWNTTGSRATVQPPENLFCNFDNECDPSKIRDGDSNDPGMGACNRTDLHCWWHQPTSWKSCTSNVCGHEVWRFDPPANYPEQADGTAYPPNCTTNGLPAGALIVDDVPAGTPIHRTGCTIPGTSDGTFSLDYGSESAKIDLHQLGAGYGGHFWFAHSRNEANNYGKLRVTGTWKLNNPVTKPQMKVFVHIPDHGAQTLSARYEVATPGGWQEVKIPQAANQANKWVELGTFWANGVTPAVRLSNYSDAGNGEDDVAFDAVAFAPGTFMTVPQITVPDGVPNSPDPDYDGPRPIPGFGTLRSAAADQRNCRTQSNGQQVCITVRPKKPRPGLRTSSVTGAEDICAAVNGGGYTRFESCEPYDVRADWTGTPNSAIFEIDRTVAMKSSSSEFVETLKIRPLSFTAGLEAISLDLDSTCSSECDTRRTTVGATVWLTSMDKHEVSVTETHQWRRKDVQNVRDYIDSYQTFSLDALVNGVKTKTTSARIGSSELQIRCDYEALGYAGCVFNKYVPNLTIDTKEYPIAAAYYWVLQEKLQGHPGSIRYDKPVHRIADSSRHKANRDLMCELAVAEFDPYPGRGTAGFPLPEMPDPSCDEYPFAAVKESGGMTLPSGKYCVQLVSRKVNGRWKIDFDPRYPLPNEVNGLWTAVCGRATIPLDQNKSAGGGVGGIVSKSRVLDGDPYYVRLPEVENCRVDTSCVIG